MNQISFFPIICDRSKPPPNTADADCIAIQSSTEKRFLCKSIYKHPSLPAVEWICAALARACGIAVADWAVIQLNGKADLMFGSVWEGGSVPPAAAIRHISNPGIFSDAHAFDLSIHNVDRHFGNYLYLDLAGDIVAKLIDSSRAFLYHGLPLPNLPMHPAENTMKCRVTWETIFPMEKDRALAIVTKISQLPEDWMSVTLSSMPDAWLDLNDRIALDLWWKDDRHQRLAAVETQL